VFFFGLLWSSNVAWIDTDDFVRGNKIATGAKWYRRRSPAHAASAAGTAI
jgi:hypothetical protein